MFRLMAEHTIATNNTAIIQTQYLGLVEASPKKPISIDHCKPELVADAKAFCKYVMQKNDITGIATTESRYYLEEDK